jgi:putative membrane protein
MRTFIIRLIINAAALWAAAYILPDRIHITDNAVNLLAVALIFGLVNALIKPIVNALTCSIHFLTLGLFTFVVNALMLMLTSYLSAEFVESALQVDGFVSALMGGVIISIVSTILSLVLIEKK